MPVPSLLMLRVVVQPMNVLPLQPSGVAGVGSAPSAWPEIIVVVGLSAPTTHVMVTAAAVVKVASADISLSTLRNASSSVMVASGVSCSM